MLAKMLNNIWQYCSLFLPQPRKLRALQKQLRDLQEEKDGILQHYKLLTGNLAASVVIRTKEGQISYCSPFTEVLTGYPVSEVYSSTQDFFETILHSEDLELYRRALRVAQSGEPFQFRFRFFHKSGIEMWAETRTVPVQDATGNLLFYLSVTLDVTGAVRYQRQVEEKNRELRDFTYMISHDLKTPIYTIKGMLTLLKEEEPKLPLEALEAFKHIQSATTRLESLVQSVLEYSKVSSQEVQFEKVSLNQVLEEVLSEYERAFSEVGATVTKQDLPDILGEKLRAYQIFSNLIGNAIKYRSPNRALTLEIENCESNSERYVKIVVKDNGSGISKDKIHAIFRPFQRANAGGIEGNGIGLACVKKLVEKFGGEVSVESEPDSGSKFYLVMRRA